jgi:voltage-gated potassium channel Kch
MPLKIPSRRAFVLVPLNVIDLISIAPFYLELIVVASSADGSGSGQLSQLAILRVLRLARVVRIFKVSKSFSPVIVLVRTLGKSLNAILMLFCFVGLGVVLFSALMYYAEQGVYYESCRCFLREDGSVSPFEDIPASGWFAIVTMTTVGYGERTVVTASGKAVAAVCMVMGIIVIALPITIIGSTFDEELKLMDIEKRNHNLLALQAHLSRTLDSTATLTLVERVLSVHEANVDNMLAQIKEQMARQRAQLNGVLVALRTQIERNGVPTVDADAAKAERDVHQVLLASKFGYNIKRSLAIGHQKSKGIVARALTGAPSSTGPESSRLGADPSTPPATPPSMPRRTRLTAGSRCSNGRLD